MRFQYGLLVPGPARSQRRQRPAVPSARDHRRDRTGRGGGLPAGLLAGAGDLFRFGDQQVADRAAEDDADDVQVVELTLRTKDLHASALSMISADLDEDGEPRPDVPVGATF